MRSRTGSRRDPGAADRRQGPEREIRFGADLPVERQRDLATAIGRTAKVYLTIPEKGRGSGQVEVVVSGRRKVLGATSTGPLIAAFSDVKVVDVRDDETLVVTPL